MQAFTTHFCGFWDPPVQLPTMLIVLHSELQVSQLSSVDSWDHSDVLPEAMTSSNKILETLVHQTFIHYLISEHCYTPGAIVRTCSCTRGGRMQSRDSDNSPTFQGQGVWMQAKWTTLWRKSWWLQQVCMIFDKDVWQFKMVSCDLPSVKLATYKLSLRG